MAKYKIVVDKDTCTGCETCCGEAPNSFRMTDDSVAEFIDPPGDDEDTVLQAAQSCPVDAISVTDKATGKQVWPE